MRIFGKDFGEELRGHAFLLNEISYPCVYMLHTCVYIHTHTMCLCVFVVRIKNAVGVNKKYCTFSTYLSCFVRLTKEIVRYVVDL